MWEFRDSSTGKAVLQILANDYIASALADYSGWLVGLLLVLINTNIFS